MLEWRQVVGLHALTRHHYIYVADSQEGHCPKIGNALTDHFAVGVELAAAHAKDGEFAVKRGNWLRSMVATKRKCDLRSAFVLSSVGHGRRLRVAHKSDNCRW